MSIIDQLQWRYATKKFDKTKLLSKDKIDIIKQAFNLTATSFGLQTLRLIVLRNEMIREKLLAHAYYQNQVVDASHLLVICIQNNITDDDVDTHFNNVQSIRSTPETVLEPFKNDLKSMMASKSIQEREEWSTKQAYIALGNLMTVCAAEHVDACPMEGFNPSAFDDILKLEALNLKSVLLLPVGFRAKDDKFADFKKVRKELSDAIIEM